MVMTKFADGALWVWCNMVLAKCADGGAIRVRCNMVLTKFADGALWVWCSMVLAKCADGVIRVSCNMVLEKCANVHRGAGEGTSQQQDIWKICPANCQAKKRKGKTV